MKNNRILIAEEGNEHREQIVSCLSAQGLGPFKEVLTPEQAWRALGIDDEENDRMIILNEYSIDLVVLDMSFGGIAGEMCKRIKEHDINLPVIGVSATDIDECEELAIESGADAFEPIPLNNRRFSLKAKKLIEKWEAHSRLRANYESLKTLYKTLPPMQRIKSGYIGKYKVIGAIGKGASSMVYKCRREDSLDFFAVKILNDELVQNADSIVGFRDEIDNIVGLNHSNVIQLIDHGIHEGFPYYAMEYVNGYDLGELEGRGPKLTYEQLLKVTLAMIDCLDFIHSKHIIHGDIKLENVLITDKWEVKLSDFGLSIQEEKKKTTIQGVLGTPLYVAPEIIAGRDETNKVDIYAFGILMYKLLSGEFPFDSSNVAEIMHHHCVTTPTRLDELCPNISRAWADLVDACLAKNPEDRPTSLAEFTQNGESLKVEPFIFI
ncbi:MAG: protein kinase [Lentisphaeraceae bacterium]|nr:protein kinase [Lentisphaeraceae bacterium]